ncbi:MAG: hypothetical protein K1X72_20350 [Pyrinomonadaceae bacterium]|nr:hypothetical protein [Pyrinomonadaceae bacterium]
MNTDKLRFLRLLILVLTFTFCLLPCVSQTLAPGAPGKDAQWATAGKQGIGTSVSLKSKVWFTLAQGVMTEVYYPDVTVANVHLLQFVVVNPKTKKVETEQDNATHQIKVLRPDSLSFQQINTAKSGMWKITKTYTTDVEQDSVLIDVRFESKIKDLNLYVYYDPSLGNSGMYDWAQSPVAAAEAESERMDFDGKRTYRKEVINKGILAQDEKNEEQKIASVVLFSSNISELTNGFYGISDGLNQLRKFGKIKDHFYAEKGNAVQMAKIDEPSNFTVSIGFANDDYNLVTALGNADKSLTKGFAKCQSEYEKGWANYVEKLPKVDPKYQVQFNMAAMILKAFEDKTHQGANIASLSIPWGGGANANEVGSSGYHAVWARDLYQVATAFMAVGDKDAATRALDFLFKVQQKTDGSFPQNSWLDGKPINGSLQMDEVAFPLILAHELGKFDKETYAKHIKPAADFIVKNGPTTPQERWEEKGGYSPSTIAAEIAGLVCAAEIAKKNNDLDSANLWLKTADDWQSNIEKWTVTTTGKYSKSPYYVRLTQNGKPDAGEKYEINGVYGMKDEREIVDAGFLELVRLGIKSPDDPVIQNSLKVVDEIIRVKTPNGEGFYRYNFDSYGEPNNGQRWNFDGKWTGKGRIWTLLSGERGQYELAWADLTYQRSLQSAIMRSGRSKKPIENIEGVKLYTSAKSRLDSMLGFANEGLMIPEQVWDSPNIPKNIDKQFVPELKFGEGTGSATPLAWSMAQFIRLAVNLKEGRNLDTPKVVYDRYVLGKREVVNSKEEFRNGLYSECFSQMLKRRGWSSAKLFFEEVGTPLAGVCYLKEKPFYEAIFMYKGMAKTVEVVGDFTGWKSKGIFLKPDPEDLKVVSLPFAPTARVEYKLIVDGKWITDPLNPNKVDNGVGGENSFFTMPDYKPTTWDDRAGDSPNAQDVLRLNSKIYGEREINIYVPDGFEKQPLPVMYLQDGNDYQTYGKSITIQRNLVKANKIKPFIMVFLTPADRNKEYWANDDYAKFLAEEVVPFIDSKYNTIKSRDGRAVFGASLGGITAVNVALKYPNVFGRIGGQSTSFWIDNERIVKDLEKLDGKTEFKFYFDDGNLEGTEDSQKVIKILQDKGFDVTYIESEAGHNWTAWRDRLADAFVAVWR